MADKSDNKVEDNRADTPGGIAQERPQDRPNVGITTPDAYPDDQKGGGTQDPTEK
jgi:hypothetical protein